jgi:hypothetical protein
MQIETTVALELPQGRIERRMSLASLVAALRSQTSPRGRRRYAYPMDWESPLDRFDRLHLEHRRPLGHC